MVRPPIGLMPLIEGTKLKETESDEGNGGGNGDGSDIPQEFSNHPTHADDDFENGPCDDGALDVLHFDFPALIRKASHAYGDGGAKMKRSRLE